MSHVHVDTDSAAGIIGTMISFSATVLSFALHALPYIQLLAASISLVAGILTVRRLLRTKDGK